ncbi:30S ribosomal protein S8 [Candidatus Micrarchaeota archaeon]|nr:30S ribosomal protein S8 [Candidatus Micrarchaeota archaeon]
MSVDHLSNALNSIKVHEMVGKMQCLVPASKLISQVLEILKREGYIKGFEEIQGRGCEKKFAVELDGRINNCGTIKPRLPVKKTEWAKTEQKYIPGIGIGLLIVSTPEGLITNAEAQEKRIGGRLVAYVY